MNAARPPGYVLRIAQEADIPAIEALDRENMRAQVERYYPGSWDDQSSRELIVRHLAQARIMDFAGQAVGHFYWWQDPPGTAILNSIQLLEAHRGRGLGGWMLAEFEREAMAAGCHTAELAVFEDNRARNLYARAGYAQIGMDGPHAFVLGKRLTP
ncbi:MAG: hypothetical protein AMXMBFR7_43180 [Planctomycetota bacterium]